MKNTVLVMKKELYRVFSDKKLLCSLFLLPAVVVVVIYGLIGVMASSMNSDIESHICSTIIVNATDGLKCAIEAAGYKDSAEISYIEEYDYNNEKSELEDRMLEGELDLIVYVQKDFDEVFASYSVAGDAIPEIKLFYNSSENYSSQAYSLFAGNVMPVYQTELLSARVGNLDLLNVFTETDQIIVKESKANSQFIAMMLPYMVMILLFAGAMSIGVDAFAGEKERGTLASMLVSPVKRTEIAMGKLIALAIIAAISSIIYCVAMVIAFALMGDSMTGIGADGFSGVTFGAGQIIQLLLMLIILDYLFVAIIALLSTLAKDTKGASSLVSPVYMVVLLSAMATMFTVGGKHETVQYLIPLYGTALALQDICTGELSTVGFISAFSVILVLAAVLTLGLAKAFDSDKLMFNA